MSACDREPDASALLFEGVGVATVGGSEVEVISGGGGASEVGGGGGASVEVGVSVEVGASGVNGVSVEVGSTKEEDDVSGTNAATNAVVLSKAGAT